MNNDINIDPLDVAVDRIVRAVEALFPVPGTPAQARELVANENAFAARMAPDIIRCVACRKLSPIGTVFGAPSDKCPPCARKAEDDERKAELWADALIDERKRPNYESQEDRDAEREYRQMRMGGRF